MAQNRKNYILFKLRKWYDSGVTEWRPFYYTRERLIHEIATYPDILNHLSTDMSEKTVSYHVVENDSCVFGYYVSYNSMYYLAKVKQNRFIPLKKEDIEEEVETERKRLEEKGKRRQRRIDARWTIPDYEYRKDPVPFVHNRNNRHSGCYYRHPATTQTKRNAVYIDEEYDLKFVNKKAKQLPNIWDDKIRHLDKSWKTSYKVKKQWMKHKNNHKDTEEFVSKRKENLNL